MNETITVRWDDGELSAELKPYLDDMVTGHKIDRAVIGPFSMALDRCRSGRSNYVEYWDATLAGHALPLGLTVDYDRERALRGTGPTAQAACNDLRGKIAAIAKWASTTLHPEFEPLHYASDHGDGAKCDVL